MNEVYSIKCLGSSTNGQSVGNGVVCLLCNGLTSSSFYYGIYSTNNQQWMGQYM